MGREEGFDYYIEIYKDIFEKTPRPIAVKRKNGFDRFPDVRFMSSDAPLYPRNIGK